MAKKLILFQQDETFTGDVKNMSNSEQSKTKSVISSLV